MEHKSLRQGQKRVKNRKETNRTLDLVRHSPSKTKLLLWIHQKSNSRTDKMSQNIFRPFNFTSP